MVFVVVVVVFVVVEELAKKKIFLIFLQRNVKNINYGDSQTACLLHLPQQSEQKYRRQNLKQFENYYFRYFPTVTGWAHFFSLLDNQEANPGHNFLAICHPRQGWERQVFNCWEKALPRKPLSVYPS